LAVSKGLLLLLLLLLAMAPSGPQWCRCMCQKPFCIADAFLKHSLHFLRSF
jgi:hypothetical protein